jgi:triosephosphate isomerase
VRKMIVAGNWKMNTLKKDASSLAQKIAGRAVEYEDVEVVLFPPFVFLDCVSETVQGTPIAIGGQNVFYESRGAYTGEISVAMLKDLGCSHVLVGHPADSFPCSA